MTDPTIPNPLFWAAFQLGVLPDQVEELADSICRYFFDGELTNEDFIRCATIAPAIAPVPIKDGVLTTPTCFQNFDDALRLLVEVKEINVAALVELHRILDQIAAACWQMLNSLTDPSLSTYHPSRNMVYPRANIFKVAPTSSRSRHWCSLEAP